MVIKEQYAFRSADRVLQEKGDVFQEIYDLLQPIKLVNRDTKKVNNEIKSAFRLKSWNTEELVLHGSQYRYDAFKNGIAIEVELSLHAYTYRDYFKFLLGNQIGKTDICILIVRHESAQTDPAQVTFSRVLSDLEVFQKIIDIPILVIGII